MTNPHGDLLFVKHFPPCVYFAWLLQIPFRLFQAVVPEPAKLLISDPILSPCLWWQQSLWRSSVISLR
jgi:hypothetical protein